MPLTPGEFLAALDDALAHTEGQRRNTPTLDLTSPHLLGETGKVIRKPPGSGPPEYTYTRAQCLRMREVLLAAARADAAATGYDDEVPYTGDEQ